MDPIHKINFKKDTTLLMILEAYNRGYEIYYMTINDLYLKNKKSKAFVFKIKKILFDKNNIQNIDFNSQQDFNLDRLNVILMRKNPPVNDDFIYACYILENVKKSGTLVINNPKSLRDYNEKFFATYFPKITPKNLITSKKNQIFQFLEKKNDIVLKPLDKMGGDSVFRIRKKDQNFSVIVDYLTNYEKKFCIAQKFLKEVKYGDKRIIIINGNPIPYCLARIPKKGEFRGNLSAGGIGEVRELTDSDFKIANYLGPFLKKKGLIFVGIDVIGKKLTEINITSPTCIKEIEKSCNISIIEIFMNTIENFLKTK